MSLDNKDGCPHCGNTVGFSFGRCSSCGFNYQTERFETIKVSPDDLRAAGLTNGQVATLVDQHATRTRRN